MAQPFLFTLEFRDRFNRTQNIKITQTERDALARQQAIRQKAVSRKQFEVVGSGVEFSRADNGVLMGAEFIAEPATKTPAAYTPGQQLRQWGLHAEAAWLEIKLNCKTLLHRAPVNSSSAFVARSVPVLFSQNV